jgi:hypothetical protein
LPLARTVIEKSVLRQEDGDDVKTWSGRRDATVMDDAFGSLPSPNVGQ